MKDSIDLFLDVLIVLVSFLLSEIIHEMSQVVTSAGRPKGFLSSLVLNIDDAGQRHVDLVDAFISVDPLCRAVVCLLN